MTWNTQEAAATALIAVEREHFFTASTELLEDPADIPLPASAASNTCPAIALNPTRATPVYASTNPSNDENSGDYMLPSAIFISKQKDMANKWYDDSYSSDYILPASVYQPRGKGKPESISYEAIQADNSEYPYHLFHDKHTDIESAIIKRIAADAITYALNKLNSEDSTETESSGVDDISARVDLDIFPPLPLTPPPIFTESYGVFEASQIEILSFPPGSPRQIEYSPRHRVRRNTFLSIVPTLYRQQSTTSEHSEQFPIESDAEATPQTASTKLGPPPYLVKRDRGQTKETLRIRVKNVLEKGRHLLSNKLSSHRGLDDQPFRFHKRPDSAIAASPTLPGQITMAHRTLNGRSSTKTPAAYRAKQGRKKLIKRKYAEPTCFSASKQCAVPQHESTIPTVGPDRSHIEVKRRFPIALHRRGPQLDFAAHWYCLSCHHIHKSKKGDHVDHKPTSSIQHPGNYRHTPPIYSQSGSVQATSKSLRIRPSAMAQDVINHINPLRNGSVDWTPNPLTAPQKLHLLAARGEILPPSPSRLISTTTPYPPPASQQESQGRRDAVDLGEPTCLTPLLSLLPKKVVRHKSAQFGS